MFPTLTELTTYTVCAIPILRVTPLSEGFYYNMDNRNEVHYVSVLKQKILTFFFWNFIFYLFLAVLGLRCCVRAFSSCGERGLLFVVVLFSLRWLLLLRSTGSRRAGFSSCGSQAQ